jgi:hypothetical protein
MQQILPESNSRLTILIKPETKAALEYVRHSTPEALSRSEAARRLLELGFKSIADRFERQGSFGLGGGA